MGTIIPQIVSYINNRTIMSIQLTNRNKCVHDSPPGQTVQTGLIAVKKTNYI